MLSVEGCGLIIKLLCRGIGSLRGTEWVRLKNKVTCGHLTPLKEATTTNHNPEKEIIFNVSLKKTKKTKQNKKLGKKEAWKEDVSVQARGRLKFISLQFA